MADAANAAKIVGMAEVDAADEAASPEPVSVPASGGSGMPPKGRKLHRALHRALVFGTLAALGMAALHYNLNDQLNNTVNAGKQLVGVLVADGQKKLYDAIHDNPEEVFPAFVNALQNYAPAVKEGQYDAVLNSYADMITRSKGLEQRVQYDVQTFSRHLAAQVNELAPDKLAKALDAYQTVIRQHYTPIQREERLVEAAFQALGMREEHDITGKSYMVNDSQAVILNADGLTAVRMLADARLEALDHAQRFQLDQEAIRTLPDAERRVTLAMIFSTYETTERGRIIQHLIAQESAQAQNEIIEGLERQYRVHVPAAPATVPASGVSASSVEHDVPSSMPPMPPPAPSFSRRLGNRIQQGIEQLYHTVTGTREQSMPIR